jgi:hypothetical protein
MMTLRILVVKVLGLVLEIWWSSVGMVLLIMDTSVRLTWVVDVVALACWLSICGPYLFRMGSILACPDSSWASTCSSCATTWLIDTYELIYKVIEALLVISLRKLLVPIVIKILMQNLLQVLMQLLSALILRKMLFIILDQFLYLLLQLFLWYLIWHLLTWSWFLSGGLVALLIDGWSVCCWWASHVVDVAWAILLVVEVGLLAVVRWVAWLIWGLWGVARLLDYASAHVVSTGWSKLWDVVLGQGCALMMILLHGVVLAGIDWSCPDGTTLHVWWICFIRYLIRGSFLQRFALLIINLTVAISRHVWAPLILVPSMMILLVCAIWCDVLISTSLLLASRVWW